MFDKKDAFFTILDQIPDNLDIDEFLAYFQTTWIQGLTTASGTGRAKFPPLSWNAYDFYMNRTNNFVESLNKRFSIVLGHSNPTIYNFISALQMEQSSTDGNIADYMVGEMPPRRKKTHSDKDRRIHSIVENYHTYEDDVLCSEVLCEVFMIMISMVIFFRLLSFHE